MAWRRHAVPAARLRALAHAAGLGALWAWLVAKQLLWSPLLHGAPAHSGPVVASAGVALLVIGLPLWLGGRARWAALLALDALLTALFQVHLLYHRQFSELASVASLSAAGEAVAVRAAIVALLRPGDALLWLDVAALAALVLGGRLPDRPPAPRRAAALSGAGLALFLAAAAPLLHRPMTGPRRLWVTRAEVAGALDVVGYQVFDAAAFVWGRLDRGGRAASLPELRAWHAGRAPATGPLSGSQRGRDVIVVQLESTQGFAVGFQVNGVPVTPALDRLARESLHFTQAYSQIGQGITSDAELLAGCSLYPFATGAVFTERADAQLRCLPGALRAAGYHAFALHANWPNFWNRDHMYLAMGFERFLDLRDFDREPQIGLGLSDARFLEQAADRLLAFPEPFHAVLVTLSTHAPFDAPGIPRALPEGALQGTEVGAYLDAIHFLDAALGRFVERLRQGGLLDRAVLVIYGDHHGLTRRASGTELLGLPVDRADVWLRHEGRVPLLIRLPGGAHAGPRDEPAGQVDLAPTLADLLGLREARRTFFGRSLVSDPPAPVVFPDGSAVTAARVWLSGEGRFGGPACLDAATGAALPSEACADLADGAARSLALSRAAVDEDLFRWLE